MTPWFILGAGALGSSLALMMERSGVTSTLLGREGADTREVLIGRSTYQVPTRSLTSLEAHAIRRLIVATKAGQIEAALAEATPFLAADVVAITTANGLGFAQDYQSDYRSFRLERAVTTAGAFRDAEGRVQFVSEGTTCVGIEGQKQPAAWFTDSLARMPGWQWESAVQSGVARKFAVNCVINPLTAFHRCLNGELLEAGVAGPELAALCSETDPALRTLGLWAGDRSLQSFAEEVCKNTAENRSSMLQDILAGRETELEYLTGELLRRGNARGLELPRNRSLYESLQGTG